MQKSLFDITRDYVLKRIAAIIAEGGKKLPTERALGDEGSASYATVRLVMKQIEAEGFIRRIQGSGSYITADAVELLRRENWRKLSFFHSPHSGRIDHDYGAWLVDEISRMAERRNWRMKSYTVKSHDQFLEKLSTATATDEAIVYLPPTTPFSANQIGELGRYVLHHPFVLLDRELSNVSLNSVASDNRRGGMLAARHLIEFGHRQLTVLITEPRLLQTEQRIQGFLEVAEIAGITPTVIDCHVNAADDRFALAYATLKRHLADSAPASAYFATSDAGAFGAFHAFQELGFKVGETASLIGFDGMMAGRKLNPPLTTVTQPVDALVDSAFTALENHDFSHPVSVRLSPVLRLGGSVARVTPLTISSNHQLETISYENN